MQKLNFQRSWRASALGLTCLPLAATFLPNAAFSESAPATQQKPNIVFILCDDLGWKDLGCYGSTFYETPNLDRLATRGMKFMNAHDSTDFTPVNERT